MPFTTHLPKTALIVVEPQRGIALSQIARTMLAVMKWSRTVSEAGIGAEYVALDSKTNWDGEAPANSPAHAFTRCGEICPTQNVFGRLATRGS